MILFSLTSVSRWWIEYIRVIWHKQNFQLLYNLLIILFIIVFFLLFVIFLLIVVCRGSRFRVHFALRAVRNDVLRMTDGFLFFFLVQIKKLIFFFWRLDSVLLPCHTSPSAWRPSSRMAACPLQFCCSTSRPVSWPCHQSWVRDSHSSPWGGIQHRRWRMRTCRGNTSGILCWDVLVVLQKHFRVIVSDIRWSLWGIGVLESLLLVAFRGHVILHFPLIAHLVLFCHVFKFAFLFWRHRLVARGEIQGTRVTQFNW